MAAPLDAGLPPFLTLDVGDTVSFTALDATTGAVVAGVIVRDMGLGAIQEPLPPIEESGTPPPVFLIPGPALPV